MCLQSSATPLLSARVTCHLLACTAAGLARRPPEALKLAPSLSPLPSPKCWPDDYSASQSPCPPTEGCIPWSGGALFPPCPNPASSAQSMPPTCSRRGSDMQHGPECSTNGQPSEAEVAGPSCAPCHFLPDTPQSSATYTPPLCCPGSAQLSSLNFSQQSPLATCSHSLATPRRRRRSSLCSQAPCGIAMYFCSSSWRHRRALACTPLYAMAPGADGSGANGGSKANLRGQDAGVEGPHVQQQANPGMEALRALVGWVVGLAQQLWEALWQLDLSEVNLPMSTGSTQRLEQVWGKYCTQARSSLAYNL